MASKKLYSTASSPVHVHNNAFLCDNFGNICVCMFPAAATATACCRSVTQILSEDWERFSLTLSGI